jgi:hypothetical protein
MGTCCDSAGVSAVTPGEGSDFKLTKRNSAQIGIKKVVDAEERSQIILEKERKEIEQ